MKDLEMIISYEDLERNRKKHLMKDKMLEKKRKQTRIKNIIGIVVMYLILIGMVLAIDYKFSHEEQQKSAIERIVQIAQKQNR